MSLSKKSVCETEGIDDLLFSIKRAREKEITIVKRKRAKTFLFMVSYQLPPPPPPPPPPEDPPEKPLDEDGAEVVKLEDIPE